MRTYKFTDKKVGKKTYKLLRFYDAAGVRREKSFTSAKLRQDFVRKNPLISNSGEVGGDLRFEAVAEEYFMVRRSGSGRQKPLEESTVVQYENHYNKRFKHLVARKKIADITHADVEKIADECVNRTEKRETASASFKVFRFIMKYAISRQYISTQPAPQITIEIEQRKSDEVSVYSDAEFTALMRAGARLRDSSHPQISEAWRGRYYPMLMLLSSTGIRISECLALRPEHFGDDFRELNIQLRIARPQRGMSKEARIGPPKSRFGFRTVGIVEPLREPLKALARETNSWMFKTTTGEYLDYTNVRTRMWKRVVDEAKLDDLGIHSLRHRYASKLIESDANMNAVSRSLGHHSVDFTMKTYFHFLPGNRSLRDDLTARVADSMSF